MPRFVDLTGHRFGRLVALAYAGQSWWKCQCDCGTITNIRRLTLRNGTCQSCGCLQRELMSTRRRVHGASVGRRTPEYQLWRNMKSRCLNPNMTDYAAYGGRGITIHAEWRASFPAFLAAVGQRPSPYHSLDRIDNNRGYEPGNVRWALPGIQANNTRRSLRLTLHRRTQSMTEWAREYGIPSDLVYQRMHTLKWTLERALTTPKQVRRRS